MEDIVNQSLSDDFLKGANVIEFHFTNGDQVGHLDNDGIALVPIGFERPPKYVPREYKRHSQQFVEYAHKNMTYSYDIANDAQRNIARSTVRETQYKGVYVRALMEDVLPCHQFPCTTEIHSRTHIDRKTYVIHNRLLFIVDFVKELDTDTAGYYTYTVRYNHAENAERTKIMQLLKDTFAHVKL